MDRFIGKMLDNRYEILEVIGVGGMAVVYKARCHRLNRLVAVKVMKEDFSGDEDFRRRFYAESQAVAMLSHPNIVAVYDVSRSAEVEYIVMELIDGITLKQYMQKKGILNWRESLHFVSQIVKALSHAHSRGIIHRDIKPHNIMILRDGSVKVADFGIARFASKQNTLTQEALGSVHYISPEQAKGSHIDNRSDLYSVGVVLYEMLTGRLPYEGDNAVSVAIQHINSMPLSPREINADIPEALEKITKKAMAANLTKRYAGAEEMLAALEEFRKNPAVDFDYELSETVMENKESAHGVAVVPGGAKAGRGSSKSNKDRVEEKRQIQRESMDDQNLRTRRNNSTVSMLVGFLGVLAFLGVAAFLVITLINGVINPDEVEKHVVPRVIYSVYDKTQLSIDYPDLVFEVEKEEYSDYPRDYILEQKPAATTTVLKGSKVLLTVSLGPRTFQLPELKEMEYRNAQYELAELKLRSDVKFGHDDFVPRDHVIYTEPAAETTLREGDYVTIYVSLGKDVKTHKMPLLTGMQEAPAVKLMEDYYLTVSLLREENDAPAGEVIRQSIMQGVDVAEGDAVTLTISEGPPPTEEPVPTEDPPTTAPPPSDTPPPVETPTPTPPPSESPTESPPPAQQNFNKTIILPPTPGEVEVIVRLMTDTGETEVHRGTYDTSMGTITIPITGFSGDWYNVFFDGGLADTFRLGE